MMVKPVEEDPFVEMSRWGIMRDPFGYRLVGRENGAARGRISSPVIAWDGRSQTATTTSGRFYRLVGKLDPTVAAILLKAHAARFGLRSREVMLAETSDLEKFCSRKCKV